MDTEVEQSSEVTPPIDLHPGPYWASLEKFRVRGDDGLRAVLGPNQVGRLNVKGHEFVIMRSEAFNGLYGTAREIDRLSSRIRLIRRAAHLLQEGGGSELAVQYVADLVAQLPVLAVRRPQKTELVFDEDEQFQPSDYELGDLDFELDPAKVPRPAWRRD